MHLNVLFVHLSFNHIHSPQSLPLPCTSAFYFFASVVLYSQLSDLPSLKEGSPWSLSNLSLQQVTLVFGGDGFLLVGCLKTCGPFKSPGSPCCLWIWPAVLQYGKETFLIPCTRSSHQQCCCTREVLLCFWLSCMLALKVGTLPFFIKRQMVLNPCA